MKGQFFLLGAFLVVALFYMGLPRNTAISFEKSADLGYFMANMQKEFPNSYNLGINTGDPIGTVRNFTWFADRIVRGRRAVLNAVIGMGNNDTASNYNVTVFNYYGSNLTINITIKATMKQLFVANNQSNNSLFTAAEGVEETFNISFKYASEEKNMTWPRDKRSIYGMVKFNRTGSTVVGDFYG
jgi:hypothetical protein